MRQDVKVSITSGMFTALIVNLVYAKAIGMTQGIMERQAGGDFWMATLLATVQGAIVMFVTVWVVGRLPNRSLAEQADALFGKWMGKLVHLLLFFFFAGAFGAITITFVYHLMDYFLPDVPILIFVLAIMVVTVYAIFHGLEVTARMAVVGVFSILVLNILLLMGSLRDFDVTQLLPVFESGVVHTLWVSRHHDADWALPIAMAGMILPYVNKPKEWRSSALAGVFFGGVTVMLWPILESGVLSPQETGHYIVACMQMARSAEIGNFLHRYEMIMVAFFGISILVQLMMCLFCASLAAAKVVGAKDYRPTIVPVAAILGAGGYYLVLDHNRAMAWLSDVWPWLAVPVGYGLPLLLALVSVLRRGKLKRLATMGSSQ